MSDFIPAAKEFEPHDRITNNNRPENEPNAFQDFAASLWGGPSRELNQSGGALHLNKVMFDEPFTLSPNATAIPELPGVQTTLQGKGLGPKTEVTIDAKVAEVMPDYNNPRNGLTHEQFIIEMADGTDVFVAHDLNYAPRVPLKVGEEVEIKGEWIPEPEQHGGMNTIGVLHWTHHSESEQRHQSGYIKADGQTYQ